MQLVEQDKIHNVDSFLEVEGVLCYSLPDDQELHVGSKCYPVKRAFKQSRLWQLDHYVSWSTGTGSALLYSIKDDKIIHFDEQDDVQIAYSQQDSLFDDCLIVYERANKETKIYKRNIYTLDKVEISFAPDFHQRVNGQHIWLQPGDWQGPAENRNDLIRYDTDFNPLWTYKVTGTYQKSGSNIQRAIRIRDIRGIYANKIWLEMVSDEVIALDLATGAELLKIPATHDMALDTVTGQLIALNHQHYYEIDLNAATPELVELDIKANLNIIEGEGQPSGNMGCFNQDYIFYYSQEFGRIGVFDRQSKQTVASYQPDILGRSMNMIKEMQCYDNRLYVLDAVDTLHVLTLEP
ncbi:hypothetical protein [Motilimonas sp. KMU-193]|uniref:hypothetical protein n=1 Tax=Motilimonas sp. KMU-193 TaxID=3388668 RepID=UPI00396B074A